MYYELTRNCIKAEKGLLKNLIRIFNKIVGKGWSILTMRHPRRLKRKENQLF